MGWITPTGHGDPNSTWSDETDAYDGNLGTYATGQVGSTAYLSLSLAEGGYVTTYKIRIYCSDDVGGAPTEIEVFTMMAGEPQTVEWIHFHGTIPALTWTEIEFNSLVSVSTVHIRKMSSGNWRLYELQAWSGSDGYQSPVPENYIIANENVVTDALSKPMQRKLVVDPYSRIHCVFRKCIYGGRINHVYYAYSDDYGKTWIIEDPVPALRTYEQHTPSIAVDSSGTPHIVFKDTGLINGTGDIGRYVKRSAGGSWTLSNFYVGSLSQSIGADPSEFLIGDEVLGITSGKTGIVTFNSAFGASKILGLSGGGSGFIEDETITNITRPPNHVRYLREIGPEAGTSLVISPDDKLRMVSPGPHGKVWYWRNLSPNVSFRHAYPIRVAQHVAIDISPSNTIPIVSKDGDSYYDQAGDTLICTGTYGGAGYPFANFSIASDADGNVHLVVAETGLGGDFSGILNIKYYKRINLVWSGPTHITDINAIQGNPSISIDFQNRIHIMWHGKGWGAYTGSYSVLMRTYENGAWGATQIILNNEKNQGEYGPSLLHAWHPNSNRLQEPVYVFSRQGSWKIQFGGDFHIAGPPDSLLCEQTKNPANVSDPKPEFSAVYR